MREKVVELGGKELTLVANYKRSVDIANRVGDPLFISREANLEAYFVQQNIEYTPKWQFTLENTVTILAIATGKTKEEIGELVFEAGLFAARDVASDYLLMIVGPQPESDINEAKGPTEEK